MIQKYNEFIFERKLEYFLYSINEELSLNDFKDKIIRFLPNIKTKEECKLFILKIINKFKLRKFLLFFLIKSILTLSIMTFIEISDLLKDNNYKDIVIEYKKYMKPKNEFIDKLLHRESSGRPNIVKSDKFGKHTYIGGFQFSKIALKDIGKSNITSKEFKKNPKLFTYKKQIKALDQYMKKNEHYLRNYMVYIGKEINNIEITKSGMLAAAHLVGQYNVKKFLKTNGKIDSTDGNGVKCSTYMRDFAGYDVD